MTVPNTVSISAGERKTLTALFADIKGSTELMEDIDPEEAQALIDPALRLMIEAVQHFDGYIVQSTGDGVFAVFGAPVAHEDHPQRALYAALRMQDQLREYGARLRAEGRPPIEIRVGVNTGEVVVRSIQTGARNAEYTPIGYTTNLAARLQTIASTGSIVISKDTERIVAGYFVLKPLGPVKIRGISDPVEVFEVGRPRPLADALAGLRACVGCRNSSAAHVKSPSSPTPSNSPSAATARSLPQWPMPVSASPASSMSSKRSQAPAPSCSTPIRSRTARPPPICP